MTFQINVRSANDSYEISSHIWFLKAVPKTENVWQTLEALLTCLRVYRTIMSQGSHRNSETQFHDYSMIFHDQQCNFHDYLIHSLQPPLLAVSSPH